MDILIDIILKAGRSAVELSLFVLLPVMVVMLSLMRLLEAKGILDRFVARLAPLLRHRSDALRGILNGVDTGIWNPATDPALPFAYAANRLAAKRANKTALQTEMGLDVTADRPLFGVISRLPRR